MLSMKSAVKVTDWIQLAQNRVPQRAVVNTAIKRVSSGGKFLASKRLSFYEERLWFIQFAMSQSALSYLRGLQHPRQIMLAFTS